MQLIIFFILGLLILNIVGAVAGMILDASGPAGCAVALVFALVLGIAMFH